MRTGFKPAFAVTVVALVASSVSLSPAQAWPLADTPKRWSVDRVLKQDYRSIEDPSTFLVTGRNSWELAATVVKTECPQVCQYKYKLREHRPGKGWTKPKNLPSKVWNFDYTLSPKGAAWMTYRFDGKLWAARHNPRGNKVIGKVVLDDTVATNISGPVIAAGPGGRAIVDFDRTWYQRAAGSTIFTPRPQPAETTEDITLGYAASGDLLAFWNAGFGSTGRLRFAPVTDAGLGAEQDLGGRAEWFEYRATRNGGRLVTAGQAPGMSVYEQQGRGATTSFGPAQALVDPGGFQGYPQLLVDDDGTFTVAYQGPEANGRLFVWQEQRPGSSYLSTPTAVPGTERGGGRIVTSPNGTLTAAYLPQVRRPRPVAVTHLPAGKRRWSKVDKIRSTRPTVYTQYYVGVPRANGDLTLVVRDKPGVLAFTYHAPRYR